MATKIKIMTSAQIAKELGLKTKAQLMREVNQQAKSLPTETKRIFWQAMLDGKTFGDASALAGIADITVAGALHLQCYKKITYTRPLTIDEII